MEGLSVTQGKHGFHIFILIYSTTRRVQSEHLYIKKKNTGTEIFKQQHLILRFNV